MKNLKKQLKKTIDDKWQEAITIETWKPRMYVYNFISSMNLGDEELDQAIEYMDGLGRNVKI